MEAPRQAIAFGDVFVDNATRADYSSSSNKIEKFNVYGTVSANGNTVDLFGGNGAVVSRDNKDYGVAWSCSESEYWIPGANYQFEAVVDGTITNGEIAYTIGDNPDNDGVNDLLYATATVTTDTNATPNGVNTNGVVAFNFTHLLSKIGFSFTNGVTDNDAYTFNVKGVSFTGHDTNGTYTISTGKWDDDVTGSDEALSFGAAGAVAKNTAKAPTTHQIIPGKQTLAITITYDIIYNGKTMSPNVKTTKSLNNHTFEKNKVYNIAVVLPAPGNPIQFSVKETDGVDAWVDGGEAKAQ